MEKNIKFFIGAGIAAAIIGFAYWLSRPVKKKASVQIENQIPKQNQNQQQTQEEPIQHQDENLPLHKQQLIQVFQEAQKRLADKMQVLKKEWIKERKKYHKVNDTKYREIVESFSKIQQQTVDESIKESLAFLNYEVMQFRIWLSMYSQSQEVKQAIVGLTDAILLANTKVPEFIDQHKIEEMLEYQAKRMEEMCFTEKSFTKESISYISCFISDEMQEKFQMTEEEINASQAYYKKCFPQKYQEYFEMMQRSASNTLETLQNS